jgi:hypothetical protein
MMARDFKSVGWVAAVGAAALGCYMLSLQVASERAELASMERRIIAAKQDIRSLQTELGTRGRLSQLEQWNAEVLALSAPATSQFLADEVMLARFETHERTVEDRVPVRMASHETVTAPDQVVATAQPHLIRAAANVAPAQPLLKKASYEAPEMKAAPASPQKVVGKSAATAKTAAEPLETLKKKTDAPKVAKAKAAPVKPAGLLSADVLGDIGAAARNETRKGSAATR